MKQLILALTIFFLSTVGYTQELYLDQDLIAVFNSKEMLLENDPIPECSSPYGVEIVNSGKDFIEITWKGPKAKINGIRYQVRFRQYADSEVVGWSVANAFSKNRFKFTNLQPGNIFEVEIRKLCDGQGTIYKLASDWVQGVRLKLVDNGQDAELFAGEDCTLLEDASYKVQADGSYLITVEGIAAVYNSYRYEIRYKRCNAQSPFTSAYIFTGNTKTITPGPDGLCDLDIRLIFGGENENYDYYCQWQEVLDYQGNIPPVICDGSGSIPTITNQNPLVDAEPGDIFYISGLPILLEQVSGSNGSFSGEGLASLPFGEKQVKVSFSSISVNENFEVFAGQVTAIPGDPANYPNFTPPNPTFSSPYCEERKTKEGWNPDGTWGATGLPHDPFGFNIDGEYVNYNGPEPSDPNYDPNGFDVDGYHIDTGTRFGPDGCSRDSVDIDGGHCIPGEGKAPYYWLRENPATKAGVEFYESINDTLRPTVIRLLNDLKTAFNDSLNNQYTICDNIRTDVNNAYNSLGFTERDYVFGDNDKYLNEGLSSEFASEPKKLQINMERTPGIEDLENNHVLLYNCDKKIVRYKEIIELIDTLLQEHELDAIIDLLKPIIEAFTEEEVELYEDFSQFEDWLNEWLENYINQEHSARYGGDLGFIESFPENTHHSPFVSTSIYAPIASSDPYFNNKIEDYFNSSFFHFEFLQGFKKLGGVHRAYFLEFMAKTRESNLLVTEENLLPIVLKKEIAGVNYRIYLDNIVIRPSGGALDAYFILEFPSNGKEVVFQLENISFGPGGQIGEARLRLLEDPEIPLTKAARLKILGSSPDTYVGWNCDGFTGMSVSAEIEFCREYIVPLDPVTLEVNPDPTAHVMAYFTTSMPAWGEFIAQLTIDPFALKNHEEVKWEINGAELDFSDIKSPSVPLPPGYESPHTNGGALLPSWRGFYLQNASVTFPTKFSKDGVPKTIGVNNMLIDDMGFSGEIFALDLIPLSDGSLDGWAFSIDEFRLGFVANQLQSGTFSGHVNVPLFSSSTDSSSMITPEDCMIYSATIYPGNNYSFLVTSGSDYDVDLFKASARINSSSFINIKYENESFHALAHLNGIININSNLTTNLNLTADSIIFEGLEISNKAPYFSPGTWSLPGSVGTKLGNFTLSVGDIGLYNRGTNQEVELRFKTDIQLVKKFHIKASGAFGIQGELEESGGIQRWKYTDFEVYGIGIDVEISNNRIVGGLEFFKDDPNYGAGFQGYVKAKFVKFAGVDALALFGATPSYRYFFVDALVTLDQPLGTGLQLRGFGGGLSYHMERESIPPSLANAPDSLSGPLPPIGQSLSGAIYTPDESIGLGITATICFSILKEEAFNGNATFGISFFSGGGVEKIFIEGNGKFMSAIDFGELPIAGGGGENGDGELVSTPGLPNSAKMSAWIYMQYDFANNTMDGDIEVFLNAGSFIQGVGENGRMGWAKLHFGSNWFVNVGTPNEPLGLKMAVAGINLAQITAYVDIGNGIPDMPKPPANVTDITGQLADFSSFRKSGKGFAFGASLTIGTGEELRFLFLYASLQAGAGFDIYLQDFGEAKCAGESGPIGINGWYASGQAWAYINAEAGLRVKLWGKERKFSLVEVGAAAALQLQAPNPFYATGAFGLEWDLLGGIIKGNTRFKFELGEQCNFEEGGNPILEIPIVSSVNPEENARDVDVSSSIRVQFNLPVGREFDFPGTESKYRVELREIKLLYDSIEVYSELYFSTDHFSLEFDPSNFLPENDSLTFVISLDIYEDGTFNANETKEVTFYTGTAPNYIPTYNVSSSYPLDGMQNFYKDELVSRRGYIQLESGQEYLFAGKEDKIIARFSGTYGNAETSIEYDYYSNRIYFGIPDLSNQTQYSLQIIDNSNVSLYNGFGGGGFVQGPAAPEAYGNGENVMLTINFRTSQYNTFKAKVDSYTAMSNATVGRSTYVINSTEPEGFDKFETEGQNNIPPFVDLSPNLHEMSWFTLNYRQFYKPLPLLNIPEIKITWRPTSGRGFEQIPSFSEGAVFSDENRIVFNAYYQVMRDFEDIKKSVENHITERVLENSELGYNNEFLEETIVRVLPQELRMIRTKSPVSIKSGDVKIRFKYRLPDGTKTSEFTRNL